MRNKKIARLSELDIKNRRVLVRVDFNVPLKTSAGGLVVADPARIEGALETIRYIIAQEGMCILASHLGRPDGKPNPKYSLEPAGKKLSELLGKDVVLTDDCIGDGPRGLSHQMRPGDVMLLENLRFHAGEEENSPEFANRLMELCDVFVNDAFGALHRAHASTSALPKLVAYKGMGLLVERELKYLEPLRENPESPFVLVMGGAKVSDKIGILEHFLEKVNTVMIGGAMAYAFLKAQDIEIGKSYCDEKQVFIARKVLNLAQARKVKMLVPVDHLVTTGLEHVQNLQISPKPSIPDGLMGVDIGPETLKLFSSALEGAKTIFWNGPMGVFETPAYAKGTLGLAEAIANSSALKLAGGGDSAAAISQSGLSDRFDFISTGGGATLEYLEGKELPGLEALQIPIREPQ